MTSSKWVFFTKRKPSFSDTWQRSRRENGWKRIVRTFRIFLDLSKSSEIKKIRSLCHWRYMVGICSKNGQGWKMVKKVNIWKVLRMGLPIVESLSGPQESIFSLLRGPQLNSRKKCKNWSNFIELLPLSLFPHVGPMAVWGPLGCCY